MSLTGVRSIGVTTILVVVAAMASCGGGSVENDKADVPVATEEAPLRTTPISNVDSTPSWRSEPRSGAWPTLFPTMEATSPRRIASP